MRLLLLFAVVAHALECPPASGDVAALDACAAERQREGDIAAALPYLRAAQGLRPSSVRLDEIERLAREYGPVVLCREPEPHCAWLAKVEPVGPLRTDEQRAAVARANRALAETGRFEGALPIGAYEGLAPFLAYGSRGASPPPPETIAGAIRLLERDRPIEASLVLARLLESNPEQRTEVRHHLARALEAAEMPSAAVDLYTLVARDATSAFAEDARRRIDAALGIPIPDDEAVRALERLRTAGAHLRAGDVAASEAELDGVDRDVFLPEAELLRATLLIEGGRHRAAAVQMTAFEERYRPVVPVLDAAEPGSVPAEGALPEALRAAILRDPFLASIDARIAAIDREMLVVARQGPEWMAALGARLLPPLVAKRESLARSRTGRLHFLLRVESARLGRLLENARALRELAARAEAAPDPREIVRRAGGLPARATEARLEGIEQLSAMITEIPPVGDDGAERLHRLAELNAEEAAARGTDGRPWLERAIALHRQVLAEFPTYPRADAVTLSLATALRAAGAGEAARDTATRLLETWPDSPLVPDAYMALGLIQAEQRRYLPAISAFEKAASFTAHPGAALARYRLAWCHHAARDPAKAIETMQGVVETDLRADALGALALLYGASGRKVAGRAWFRERGLDFDAVLLDAARTRALAAR